ncbi:MAG TPA: 3-phosphoshikimate 1-carboxyvinyltransferase [Opitutae bacterium]|nr:3-phosphoshikimate 1-carboxyvinyltransferase [Opitutae bacterium]
MQDPYPIPPFTVPVSAKVAVPGSKSITNRAILLAALSEGETRLDNCLFSRDTEIMISAIQDLGFEISKDKSQKGINIRGLGGLIPNTKTKLDIGNSGTSARFLTAILATCPEGDFELDGDAAMRKRPIQKLANTLISLGCRIDTSDGFFPIRIRPQGLKGGKATVDASESSQFVSALLMAAPLAKEKLEIKLSDSSIRRGYIDLTLKMMERFGISPEKLSASNDSYQVNPAPYSAPRNGYLIESDASAASYFIALPLSTGGVVEIEGIYKDSLQGDIAFAQIAEQAGVTLEWRTDSLVVSTNLGSNPISPLCANYYAFSDTFMTGAAISPLANSPTLIEGIGHTRHQECDRIEAMAAGLANAGQNVHETESSIEITPSLLKPATIETYEDHRIAMSFGILGSHDALGNGKPWLNIVNPLCCRKTFPKFFDVLESAREQSLANQS